MANLQHRPLSERFFALLAADAGVRENGALLFGGLTQDKTLQASGLGGRSVRPCVKTEEQPLSIGRRGGRAAKTGTGSRGKGKPASPAVKK